MKADWVVAGAGLFGGVFAFECRRNGVSCAVFDARGHAGGNVHSERRQWGIDVHLYGPHIFNTNSGELYNYARQFGDFNEYRHRVVAVAGGKSYSFPINRMTLDQVYGANGHSEWVKDLAVQRRFQEKCGMPPEDPKRSLASYCRYHVGEKLYDLFYLEYSAKHWGRNPDAMPASVAARIPVRRTYDDRYHDTEFSGVPRGGWGHWTANLFDGTEVHLNQSLDRDTWQAYGKRLLWTGAIDAYFGYALGKLEYRSLDFRHECYEGTEHQGVAQVNYCDKATPFTRTVEHFHFQSSTPPAGGTVVTYETPLEWKEGLERYYPIRTRENQDRYAAYRLLASAERDVVFGGRLGSYRYTNMDATIANALKTYKECNK
jgi:UDP-galactopyranose mutase